MIRPSLSLKWGGSDKTLEMSAQKHLQDILKLEVYAVSLFSFRIFKLF